MLLKNLILSALLAGKSLASPLSVTIKIDDDRRYVQTIDVNLGLPYELIVAGLETQQAALEDLTNSVLTLEDVGSKGFEQTVQDLRAYIKTLYSQKKSLPGSELSEGETLFVENAFVKTTDALGILGEVVYGYNATIKPLDTEGKFYKRFIDVRISWGNYFKALKPLLYVCDADEKENGCEGITPFNRIHGEIGDVLRAASKAIYQKSLVVQLDL